MTIPAGRTEIAGPTTGGWASAREALERQAPRAVMEVPGDPQNAGAAFGLVALANDGFVGSWPTYRRPRAAGGRYVIEFYERGAIGAALWVEGINAAGAAVTTVDFSGGQGSSPRASGAVPAAAEPAQGPGVPGVAAAMSGGVLVGAVLLGLYLALR